MALFKRTKFVLDAFRSSRVIPNRNPIQESIFQYPKPTKGNIFQLNNLNYGLLNQNNVNPFYVNGRRRFYCVDKGQVLHFSANGHKKYIENPKKLLIVATVCMGIVNLIIYFWNLETVPYTKRRRTILVSRSHERQLGEIQVNGIKDRFKGKILPATHPDSVRVRLIAKAIIESLPNGLSKEHVWTDVGYTSSGNIGSPKTSGDGSLKALSDEPVEGTWSKDDEILDNKSVQQSRKQGLEKGEVAATGHLDGLNWEVFVVNEPVQNSFCMFDGKIVVFTGLLERVKSDAEIATIIGHEVAHGVARHAAEQLTKDCFFDTVQWVLGQFLTPDNVEKIMSSRFHGIPSARRMEMEADHIGLMLMASAGYDPRVAPSLYEELDKLTGGDSILPDYRRTHPSGKKRAQFLTKVMEEALLIYGKNLSRKGVEGSIEGTRTNVGP